MAKMNDVPADGQKKKTPAPKKLVAQTRGQFERDPKGRKGQYTGAGESALTKK